MSKLKTSREAFEEWFVGEYVGVDVEPDTVPVILAIDDGIYSEPAVQYSWEAWQAACQWADRMED